MKKILIISMMLVFGFSFSQEKKSETPKEPEKIEKTSELNKGEVRVKLNLNYNRSNFDKLFYVSKRKTIKLC